MYSAKHIPEISCHTSLTPFFSLMNGVDGTYDKPLHSQKYYEILYIVSGQGYVTVNSQKLFLSTGDYIILLPKDTHSLKAKDFIHFYSIEFTIQDSFLNHYLYSDIKSVFTRSSDTPVTVFKNSSIKPILENMFKEWQTRAPLYVPYITLLFQQLLIQCSRIYSDAPISSTEEGQNSEIILDNFLSFLDAYMDKPDVISLYEQNYGVKRTALTALSKKAFGKTIFQLYTLKRFEYALNLLADRKFSISDVAKRCAFSSVAAFSKAFTHYYGKSPSQYLKDSPLTTKTKDELPTYFVSSSEASGQNEKQDKQSFEDAYTNPKLQLI